jgi:hypothetical protein
MTTLTDKPDPGTISIVETTISIDTLISALEMFKAVATNPTPKTSTKQLAAFVKAFNIATSLRESLADDEFRSLKSLLGIFCNGEEQPE